MNALDWYLARPYIEGARGPYAFDCWGLVRHVLLTHFGVPESAVPAFGGVLRGAGMQSAYEALESAYRRCEPVEGALACVFKGRVLEHIGIVYQGRVLHTREGSNVKHERITRFERSARVRWYVYG